MMFSEMLSPGVIGSPNNRGSFGNYGSSGFAGDPGGTIQGGFGAKGTSDPRFSGLLNLIGPNAKIHDQVYRQPPPSHGNANQQNMYGGLLGGRAGSEAPIYGAPSNQGQQNMYGGLLNGIDPNLRATTGQEVFQPGYQPPANQGGLLGGGQVRDMMYRPDAPVQRELSDQSPIFGSGQQGAQFTTGQEHFQPGGMHYQQPPVQPPATPMQPPMQQPYMPTIQPTPNFGDWQQGNQNQYQQPQRLYGQGNMWGGLLGRQQQYQQPATGSGMSGSGMYGSGGAGAGMSISGSNNPMRYR